MRRCDGAVIMEAEQGVLDHDPKAWQLHFTATASATNAGAPDNEVTYTLREAKELVQGWAEGLIATNDEGWGRRANTECWAARRALGCTVAGARHQLLRRIAGDRRKIVGETSRALRRRGRCDLRGNIPAGSNRAAVTLSVTEGADAPGTHWSTP